MAQNRGYAMKKNIFSTTRLNDGVVMPIYGYGVYKAVGDELKKALAYAIAAGYRMIDTASFYENEDVVGEAVKTSGLEREGFFITSKLWPTEFKDPVAALDKSLRRLQTDYLDAYLLHWPGLDESLRLSAYEKLLREREKGKIHALGVSNFLQLHLEQIYGNFKLWPPINQIEIHPHYQQKALRDFCGENGIQIMSWSPLGRGGGMEIPQIKQIAEEIGRTPAQVILRWQVQSSLVPLPKSVHDYRIRENAEIFDFELTAAQMAQICELDLPGIDGRIGKDPMLWPPME